jgi:DivIVA domain-containing protein
MQDESFHLTPVDVRRYDFGSALRGYDKQRVDQFRDQVADELERQARLVQELEAKARGFHEQLRAFRERDKALNEALVSAQQLRGEIRDQAEREAALVLREARAEGDRLIDEARSEVRRLQGEVDALSRMRRSYVAQMRALMTRQLMELEAAEAAATDAAGTLVERDPGRARAPVAPPVAAPPPEAPGDGPADDLPPTATAADDDGPPTWLDRSVEE